MPTLGNTPRPAYVYDTETDTWVPVGVGAHTHSDIPNTLVDAKGDLITATADNVPARLAKGADGTVLVSDSTTSTGLAWQPYGAIQVAGKNKILNGDFAINQRGFSSITATNYSFDRWRIGIGGDGTATATSQTFTPGAAPVAGYEGKNFLEIATTGQTSTSTQTNPQQRIESVRSFAGQTITISFWAKAASGTPKIAVEVSQGFGSGGSASSAVETFAGHVTLSTSWARYSVTVAVPSISGKTLGTTAGTDFLQVSLWTSAGSTFNARTGSLGIQTATIGIWGVQVEAGTTATDFQTATGTIQGELAACQRYYYKFGTEGSSSSFFFSPLGMANATTQVIVTVPFPQVMRAKPSSIDYLAPRVWDGVNTAVVASSLTFGDASTTSGSINANGSGFTLYRPYWLMNNSGSYIGFNAEL